jgi:AcrR family transcriptional regulator
MGISERKEREKQEMRQRIIDASLKMFVQEGYDKTSIRNIADKIEYSPATIYLYYKDKDELLYDVQARAFEKLLIEFRTHATSKSPMKRLEQICETYVRFGMEQQELYALMFIIKAPMNVIEDEEIWANGQAAFDFLLNCVAECIEKGLLRYKDAGTASLSVWSIGHGLLSLHQCCRFKVMHLEEEAIEPLVQSVVKEYLRMIKA